MKNLKTLHFFVQYFKKKGAFFLALFPFLQKILSGITPPLRLTLVSIILSNCWRENK